jgi:sortase (surface protein transpeptidase)
MNNFEASIVLLMGVAGLGMALYSISDVEPGNHRRSLQNALYRLQNLVLWLYAITAGIDAGLKAYYSTRKKYAVRLTNEKEFPPKLEPRKVQKPAGYSPEFLKVIQALRVPIWNSGPKS